MKKNYGLTLTLCLALAFTFQTANANASNDGSAAAQLTAQTPTDMHPAGAPPAGAIPPGPPPDGMGMPPMQQEAQSADSLNAVYTADTNTETKDACHYSSVNADENVVLVRNGASLTLTNAELSKSGDSSSSEDSNFTGLNAVFLSNNSTAVIKNAVLNSAAEGSNAIFSTGKSSTITAEHIKIHTTKNSSRGLDSTYGGTILADDIEIATEGAHCAALATDRGEGNVTVSHGTLSTLGDGSPCIYSTGTIRVSDSTGTAEGSEIAVVEGKNSIALENVQLTGKQKCGVMLYQSFSGDADTGTASFSAKNSNLINRSGGPMFYITNTRAEAALENTIIDSNSGLLIQVTSDHWGKEGANGGEFTFTAKNQSLKGDILANSISSITLQLDDKSSWTGAINKDHAAKSIHLTMHAGAVWNLTDDSYLNTFRDDCPDLSNIQSNGHSIYYISKDSPSLAGKTYTLPGGGKLLPQK